MGELRTDAIDRIQSDGQSVFDEEVEDKINEDKKSIPDVYIKISILKAWEEMDNTFRSAIDNKEMNGNKRFNQVDLVHCKTSVLLVYNKIKEMIKDKYPKMKAREPKNYELMMYLHKMMFFSVDPNWNQLVLLYNFLIHMLHALNITNLLIEPVNPFDILENEFN